MNPFLQRKTEILNKKDKSSIGEWDKKIISLCNKINSLENYYTTSSCSGRIVLMIDQEKKQNNLFLKVYHDLITFKQLKKDLEDINSPSIHGLSNSGNSVSNKGRVPEHVRASSGNPMNRSESKNQSDSKNIKLKQEPIILHVACKDLQSTQELLDKARLTGMKKSGILSANNKIILEINSTEKLEFPIIQNQKILVNDNFLKIITKESNQKLKKSWEKIKRLEKLIF